MNTKYYPELQEIEEQNNYLPSISIILPMHMHSEHEFLKYVKIKADELERELNKSYAKDIVLPLMDKLQTLLLDVKIDKSKRGFILFLSPLFKKVYFLDFEPVEKIVVDDSFEIRDLIYNHDIVNKAVMLLLSGNEIKYLLYENHKLNKIHVDVPVHIEAFMRETLHDVAIYYEKSERKEKAMHVFTKNADQGLSMLLKAHLYPVIVTGSDKLISDFKEITENAEHIIDFIPGNYLESTPDELILLISRSLKNLQKHREAQVLQRIKTIDNKTSLAIGVKEVWKQANLKNIDTVVIEKNYRMSAAFNPGKNEIFTYDLENVPYPIQDAVDDIIEKVISSGGKVQFVEDDSLKEYSRIVMIKKYSS